MQEALAPGGKYEGHTYKYIASRDPSYVRWVASRRNIDSSWRNFHTHCVRLANRTFVYAIILEQGNIYVGITQFPVYRLYQHHTRQGAAWTRLHRPIRGYSMLRLIPKGVSPGVYEDMFVKLFMQRHGIQAVRGGTYSSVQLGGAQVSSIRSELQHATRYPETATLSPTLLTNRHNRKVGTRHTSDARRLQF